MTKLNDWDLTEIVAHRLAGTTPPEPWELVETEEEMRQRMMLPTFVLKAFLHDERIRVVKVFRGYRGGSAYYRKRWSQTDSLCWFREESAAGDWFASGWTFRMLWTYAPKEARRLDVFGEGEFIAANYNQPSARIIKILGVSQAGGVLYRKVAGNPAEDPMGLRTDDEEEPCDTET